jgi:hypothetical protein
MAFTQVPGLVVSYAHAELALGGNAVAGPSFSGAAGDVRAGAAGEALAAGAASRPAAIGDRTAASVAIVSARKRRPLSTMASPTEQVLHDSDRNR